MTSSNLTHHSDLVIIGAGPAGLKAAQVALAAGLSVTLVDENPLPGGQLLRQVTHSPVAQPDVLFGAQYTAHKTLAETAFSPALHYLAHSTVWQISPEKKVYLLQRGENTRHHIIQADFILLATGAQERSFPLPGWTLPGAMTVGAAQLLMKTAGLLPPTNSILIGNGPLLLLYAAQVIRAGGKVQAILDTTRPSDYLRALPRLASAVRYASGDLRKGMSLLREIRRARVPYYSGVSALAIEGEHEVNALSCQYRGKTLRFSTAMVLSHIGVIPATQCANALGCKLLWDDQQQYWYPETNQHQETSVSGIYIAGDAGGIEGGEAAIISGHLAVLGILHAKGTLSATDYQQQRAPLLRQRRQLHALRPFLAALYPIPSLAHQPDDNVTICRCEQVTAGEIRQAARSGCAGINQLKAFTRCGMGPCQGRLCAHTATAILAQTQQRSPLEVGYPRARFPLKPMTLAELADWEEATSESET